MDRRSQVILAFDYGSKRIGVSLYNPEKGAPVALTTITAGPQMWSEVQHLTLQHRAGMFVVGWPRGLDGQHTQQTYVAEQFAEDLKKRYDKEVVLQDEVLTSEEARKRLDPKLPIRKQREQIDAIAAQIILEDYLREAK